jgi:hypothetical protein
MYYSFNITHFKAKSGVSSLLQSLFSITGLISGKSTATEKENQGSTNNIKANEESHKTKLADKPADNIAQALFSSPPKISPFLQQALQKSQAEANASDTVNTLMTGLNHLKFSCSSKKKIHN